MILEFLITVNGMANLPVDIDLFCECQEHSRSVECSIGTVMDNDHLLRQVYTRDIFGNPVKAKVSITCSEEQLH